MASHPSEFLCPIGMNLMTDPVVGPDGHTYDRASIESWLAQNPVSPMTREPMYISQLKPNYALRAALDRYAYSGPVAVAAAAPAAPASADEHTVVIAVLDTSGSMGENATDTRDAEGLAFTRMDLVKHSMRTVASILASRPNTSLSIIAFDSTARKLMRCLPMNERGLEAANEAIDALRPGGSTNIWDGLRLAIEEVMTTSKAKPGSDIHVILLTDGEPTLSLSPPGGILAALSATRRRSPTFTLHSFGFGYKLDSKLLSDICHEGDGLYGYIPDCSMVATVFINFCAHILSRVSVKLEPVEEEAIQKLLDLIEPIEAKSESSSLPSWITMIVSGSDKVPQIDFSSLQEWLKAQATPFTQSLLQDIEDPDENKGQLSKALSRRDWFKRWGYNHILAYSRALRKHACINFKDAALQHFKNSEFEAIKARGDELFIALPAPIPRGHTQESFASTGFSMATFNTADGGCFAGHCRVRMADGSTKRVDECLRGDILSNGSVIRCVVRRRVEKKQVKMVRFPGGLLITPWHPVRPSENMKWVFPCLWLNRVEWQTLKYFYDFVLEGAQQWAEIDGLQVLTLAHGIEGDPVASHEYYGTEKILEDLKLSGPGWDQGYITL